MKAFILLVATLFVVACSSAPPSTPNTDTEAPQTPQNEGQGAPATDSGAFERAMSQYGTMEFSVNYRTQFTIEGESTTGTMAQYFKGKDNMRTDVSAEGVETRMLIVGETITSCFKQGSKWSCQKLTSEPAESNPADTLERVTESPNEYVIVRDGTKQVAGVSADCFKITADDTTTRYCIYDSIPLYIQTTMPEGTSELEATSYSKQVAADAFDAPAEPSTAGATMPVGGDACAYCDYMQGDQKAQCLASC